MILKRLLCLCVPGATYKQVVPYENENGDDDVSGMQLMLFNIKKKFNNDESDTNTVNNERDCLSLIENIRADKQQMVDSLFADPTCIVILSFVDATLTSVFRGEGHTTAISQLRLLAGKTVLRELSVEGTEVDLKILVASISSFLDVTQRQQRSFNSRSQLSKHYLNSLSRDGSLVLTVIFMSFVLFYRQILFIVYL